MFTFDSNYLNVPNELLFIRITKVLIVLNVRNVFPLLFYMDIRIIGSGKINKSLKNEFLAIKEGWNEIYSLLRGYKEII